MDAEDLSRIRIYQPVHVLQQNGFAGSASPQDDQGLSLRYGQVDPLEHRLPSEGPKQIPALNKSGAFHRYRRRKSLVKKKSDIRIVMDAITTVFVVARPTPSAPPPACSPL